MFFPIISLFDEKIVFLITRSKEELQHVNGNKLAGFIGASAECNTSQGSGVSLPFYVQTAINLLSRNDRGFLLLIDDVHIDRASHAKNTKQIQGIMKNTDLFFRLKEVMLSPNTKNF